MLVLCLANRIFNRHAVHFEHAVHLQTRPRFVRGRGSPNTGQVHRARSLVFHGRRLFRRTVTATCITNTSGTRVELSPGSRSLVLFLQNHQKSVATPAADLELSPRKDAEVVERSSDT